MKRYKQIVQNVSNNMVENDTTSFYCNLKYVLVSVPRSQVTHVLKKGFQCETQNHLNHGQYGERLLPKFDGVYGVAVFKPWQSKPFDTLGLGDIDAQNDVVFVLHKNVVLYNKFHINRQEDSGMRMSGNTFESNGDLGDNVWSFDVMRNLDSLTHNELVFHHHVTKEFIKEIWYFKDNVPSYLYDSHIKLPLVSNVGMVLL